jgi:hypothetical protein
VKLVGGNVPRDGGEFAEGQFDEAEKAQRFFRSAARRRRAVAQDGDNIAQQHPITRKGASGAAPVGQCRIVHHVAAGGQARQKLNAAQRDALNNGGQQQVGFAVG